MPAKKEHTVEFKQQAVRFVLEEIDPDGSRKHACDRLAPKLSPATQVLDLETSHDELTTCKQTPVPTTRPPQTSEHTPKQSR